MHSFTMKTDHTVRSVVSRALMQAETPSITSTTGLQNSARAGDISSLRKDHIKAKVAYEWKSIFKALTRADPQQSGQVPAN